MVSGRDLGLRLLVLAAAGASYAFLLTLSPPGMGLTLAPLVSGVIAGAGLHRGGCGGKCLFTVGFLAGEVGSLALPLYLGSLGFHLRVAGEFLTTPVASALLLYHGLTTGLMAYVSGSLMKLWKASASPPPSEQGY